MMVTVSGTSIRKGIILFILGVMMIFTISGVMTSLKPEYRITSSSINNIATTLTGESLIYLLGYENHYFTQGLPETSESPNYTSLIFQRATSINMDDPRSFLGRELPGFSIYDSKIVVAGEGTNYTNMPIESGPPLEVLLEEREVSIQNLEQLEKPKDEKPVTPPEMTTGDRKVVYIYHSHSWESFFPHLKGVDTKNADNASHSSVNITKVGEMLGEELKARGIGTDVDTTNMNQELKKRSMVWSQSYQASGDMVKSAMASNDSLTYLIDIHRDSKRKDATTVTIDGKKYARTAFVVGSKNAQYEKNLEVATRLHKALEKKYPGLSRGVFQQGGPGNNGVYNQDKSENAMLIEFGGVDNNFEELRRTSSAIADVIAGMYWDAEKVDASSEGEKERQ